MSLIDEDIQVILNKLIDFNDGDKNAAVEEFNEMIDRVRDGECPENVLYEIGLEPDFALALL